MKDIFERFRIVLTKMSSGSLLRPILLWVQASMGKAHDSRPMEGTMDIRVTSEY